MIRTLVRCRVPEAAAVSIVEGSSLAGVAGPAAACKPNAAADPGASCWVRRSALVGRAGSWLAGGCRSIAGGVGNRWR